MKCIGGLSTVRSKQAFKGMSVRQRQSRGGPMPANSGSWGVGYGAVSLETLPLLSVLEPGLQSEIRSLHGNERALQTRVSWHRPVRGI